MSRQYYASEAVASRPDRRNRIAALLRQRQQEQGQTASYGQPPAQQSPAPQQQEQPAPAFGGGGGFGGGPQAPNLPGLQFGSLGNSPVGGRVQFGDYTVDAPNLIPAYQSLLGAQGQAYGDQLGYLGDIFRTQGANYQSDNALRGQLGVAGIQGDTQRYLADQDLAGRNYSADQTLAGIRYGADQDLAGINAQAAANRAIAETQAGASRYGADQDLAAAQVAALASSLPSIFQQQRFNEVSPFMLGFIDRLFGGDDMVGGGSFAQAPELDADAALARIEANNAAQEAATLNNPEFAGASPQADAAAQQAALTEAMANAEAGYQVPQQFAQANLDNELSILDALNRGRQTQVSGLDSLLRLFG